MPMSKVPSSPTPSTPSHTTSTKFKVSSKFATAAERRASHNAVERQRRDALNARCLELASLLPRPANVHQPTKLSIVNSSITYMHYAQRHYQIAARELHLMQLEADALRREVNAWRERANIQPLQKPERGEGLARVLDGETDIWPAARLNSTLAEEDGLFPGEVEAVPALETLKMEMPYENTNNVPRRPPGDDMFYDGSSFSPPPHTYPPIALSFGPGQDSATPYPTSHYIYTHDYASGITNSLQQHRSANTGSGAQWKGYYAGNIPPQATPTNHAPMIPSACIQMPAWNRYPYAPSVHSRDALAPTTYK